MSELGGVAPGGGGEVVSRETRLGRTEGFGSAHPRSPELDASDCAEVEGSAAARLLKGEAGRAGLRESLEPFSRVTPLHEALAANPFLMAPMAGVSDRAHRILARAGGAALAFTEMVSVTGLAYGSAKTWDLIVPDPAEPDIAVQFFGARPEEFEAGAREVAERLGKGLALVDVNMACPVPKVVRKGEGSALLDEPELAARIIEACRKGLGQAGSSAPVTAKIRLGRTPERRVAPDFAKALEASGAGAVAVHGRYASQLYRGTSDDGAVGEVARAVSIPVIGSGDVFGEARALALLRLGCSGVFFARGSQGDPWVFDRARRMLAGGEPAQPTMAERMAAWRLHVRLLGATGQHLMKARTISCSYLRGIPEAASWRNRAMACSTEDDFIALSREVEAFLEASGALEASTVDAHGEGETS